MTDLHYARGQYHALEKLGMDKTALVERLWRIGALQHIPKTPQLMVKKRSGPELQAAQDAVKGTVDKYWADPLMRAAKKLLDKVPDKALAPLSKDVTVFGQKTPRWKMPERATHKERMHWAGGEARDDILAATRMGVEDPGIFAATHVPIPAIGNVNLSPGTWEAGMAAKKLTEKGLDKLFPL